MHKITYTYLNFKIQEITGLLASTLDHDPTKVEEELRYINNFFQHNNYPS